MNIEMWAIFSLAVMLLLLTAGQGTLVPITQGLRWGLGGRDEPVEKSALQQRISRTVANHIEAMVIFVPLMLLILMQNLESDATALAAWLVIGGRLAFIPLYAGGVFGLRSAAYMAAMVGNFILIAQFF